MFGFSIFYSVEAMFVLPKFIFLMRIGKKLNLSIMKITISILILFLSTLSFSQSWTTQEKAVLTQYNLSENDHRGLEFSSDSDAELSFNNLKDALTYFLENKNVKDLTQVYVSNYPESQLLEGAIIGIKEIIQHYILTSSLN